MAEEKKKPDSAQSQAMTNKISIKLPEFISKDPELWLIQVHSQFVLANVVKEELQYHYIVSSLPQEVTINVRDVIKANVVYKKDGLSHLKDALIKRYTLSREQRVRDVLDNIQLVPGELPSTLFRRLLSTADDLVPYDLIVQRFRERLPENIAAAVAPLTNKIIESFKTSKERPLVDENTMLEVADVIKPQLTVAATSYARQKSRSVRSRQRTRSISRGTNGRFRENGNWCRNHYLYRNNANSCSRPNNCTFKSRNRGAVSVVEQQQSQLRHNVNANVASIQNGSSKRLFVKDVNSDMLFLIDTGSEVVVSKDKLQVSKDLWTSDFVYVRKDSTNTPLGLLRTGPFKVIKRLENNVVIETPHGQDTVAWHRITPAHLGKQVRYNLPNQRGRPQRGRCGVPLIE
ncbi:hypothetical protein BLOT_015263 [Blomia tropicalis]|nr:hypothetical protein BLOT_015263 [Blomia tropicalis]